MKTIASALCVLFASAGAVGAAPAKSGLLVPIHQFIDNFNKGDVKAAEAAYVAEPSIIDEVPPHHWQGAGAFRAWAGDLDKSAKASGDTDEKVTLGQVVRSEINGDAGYVVIKATFTYKEKGKAMTEPAQMAYALRKEGGDWKIAGWAWTGGLPHAAAAAPKPAPKPAATPAPAAAPAKPKG